MSESERAVAELGDYRVEDQVGFLLRRANQRHTAIFADGMAEVDLTPMQFTALVKVVEHGKVTQNLLGRLAAMDPATIQGVVRRLIDRGLVARADDPMDRRTIVLAATDAGMALARRAVVFTASPSAVTSVCASSPTAPTQASPVWTPAPTGTHGPAASLCPVARRSATAALTANAACRGPDTNGKNMATTSSPTNLSTAPS